MGTTKIGFIGAGKMATALCRGFLNAELASPETLIASDPYEQSRLQFSRETGCQAVESNLEVVEVSDIVILAVKPGQVASCCREISNALHTERHLIISIAAGVPLSTIEAALPPRSAVVRVMPNTPCLVEAGALAISAGKSVTSEQLHRVTALLESVGLVVSVTEKQLDAVTGLSGSGPAYVFQMIEALSDAGVRVGLPRDLSTRLAAQTLYGAAKMVLDTGDHPAVLKDAVTSPGGTTIAGLHMLEQGGLRAALINAVVAATNRSIELSSQS